MDEPNPAYLHDSEGVLMKSLKESRALTILVGWLDATKVPYSLEADLEKDLTVGTLPVKISAVTDITAPLDKALKVFWSITEAAGYGRPQPVDRGTPRCMRCHQPLEVEATKCLNVECQANQPQRVKFEDAPELVAIRHREFRQTANLPDSVYQDDDYKRIMKWYCYNFHRRNLRLCQDMAFDVEDLETYAMLYLTNFHGRWRKIGAKKGENGKMFCSYLQQRFYSDLLPLLKRKSQNILADEETVDLGLDIHHVKQYGAEDDRGAPCAVKNDQELDIWQEIRNLRHGDLLKILRQKSSEAEGEVRIKATQLLHQHWMACQTCNPFDFDADLQKFSHQEYLDLLNAMTLVFQPGIRSIARGRLNIHRAHCDVCTPIKAVTKVADKLAELLYCPKCKQMVPKEDVGVRVMKRDVCGVPIRIRRQSYCQPCRSVRKPASLPPPGDTAGIEIDKNHTGQDSLSGKPLFPDSTETHLAKVFVPGRGTYKV